jgi:hypothetical protein
VSREPNTSTVLSILALSTVEGIPVVGEPWFELHQGGAT